MHKRSHGGFLQIIVIIFIAIILFSYFGIDLRQVFSTPVFQKNIQFTGELITTAWTNYIYDPLMNILHSTQSSDKNAGSQQLNTSGTTFT